MDMDYDAETESEDGDGFSYKNIINDHELAQRAAIFSNFLKDDIGDLFHTRISKRISGRIS